jgi:hypothetical protein
MDKHPVLCSLYTLQRLRKSFAIIQLAPTNYFPRGTGSQQQHLSIVSPKEVREVNNNTCQLFPRDMRVVSDSTHKFFAQIEGNQ